MTDYIQKILQEKVAKIHEISEVILKDSYPLCRNGDIGVLTSGQSINRGAYQMKCLTEQMSGLLRD